MDDDRREQRRDARAAWCAERRVGDHTAVFRPGEELRCPGTKTGDGGGRGPCGAWLDGFVANAASKVIVRAIPRRLQQTDTAGLGKTCRDCGWTLEVVPMLEATG